MSNIIAKNIPVFSRYGTVSSSKAIIDQKTGECKGYGFAMFEREKDCEEAIEGLNKSGFQASYAKVGQESFSSRLRHLQDETSTNIYISNLPLDITEQVSLLISSTGSIHPLYYRNWRNCFYPIKLYRAVYYETHSQALVEV